MKRTRAKIAKANKSLTAWVGLFVTIVAAIVIIQNWRTKDATGRWKLTFTNVECTYTPYVNETCTQTVTFIQTEKNVTGTGEKLWYNGKKLPPEQRRRLEYKGTISGKELTLNYDLHGKRRETGGIVRLSISKDGETLEGIFQGDAGECGGTVQ